MKWNKYDKKSNLHTCPEMDMYLTSLGFSEKSVKHLKNPCQIHDKYLLKNVKEASEFLKEAIMNNKKIIIIGDYDADGVTSTACLALTLRYCKGNVEYIIPHRIRNGYGLSKDLVDKAILHKADIILTCDNGIAAIEAVQYARDNKLDVIVTDHHTPGDELPNANLIIHPMLGGYPFPYISGAQTAYKLCLAIIENASPLKEKKLIKKAQKINEDNLKDYLFQLSTISIVSDVMPVASADEALSEVNENRRWLMEGIEMIRKNPNWRIAKLMEVLNVNQENFEETSIGFYLAPCLNAVGRLSDAAKAVDFLTSETEKEAKKKLAFLQYLNEERKKVKTESLKKINLDEHHKVNLVVEEGLHEGVLGILASHFTNQNSRPSFIMTNCVIETPKGEQKAWKGSGRGIEGLNLYNILKEVQDKTSSIYAYGGHAGAVGLTVMDENIETFSETLRNIIDNAMIHSTYTKNYIELKSWGQRDAFAESIKELKPFGNGLPLPIAELNYNVKEITLYYKSKHVKFTHMEPKGGTWSKFELWLYSGLESIKPLCLKRFSKSSDNVQKLVERGLPLATAEAEKMEVYVRNTPSVRLTYKVEIGYSDFQGMGPRYNVVEVEMK